MKLWRKLGRKQEDGTRTGRSIKYQMQMSEYFLKNSKKSYPLLDALFKHAGVTYALTAKQQEALQAMFANAGSHQHEEATNETV